VPVRSRRLWGPQLQTATLAPTTVALYTVPAGRTLVLRSLRVVLTGAGSLADPRWALLVDNGTVEATIDVVRSTVEAKTEPFEIVRGLSMSFNPGDILLGQVTGGSAVISTVAWSMGSGSLLMGPPE
jgi:hypothetical protein